MFGAVLREVLSGQGQKPGAVSTVCAPIHKPELGVVQAITSCSYAAIACLPCSWRLEAYSKKSQYLPSLVFVSIMRAPRPELFP